MNKITVDGNKKGSKIDNCDFAVWAAFTAIISLIYHFYGKDTAITVVSLYLIAIFITMVYLLSKLDKDTQKDILKSPFPDIYVLIFYGWGIWFLWLFRNICE